MKFTAKTTAGLRISGYVLDSLIPALTCNLRRIFHGPNNNPLVIEKLLRTKQAEIMKEIRGNRK